MEYVKYVKNQIVFNGDIMLELAIQEDQDIRQYSKRLHYDLGEDAYHNVVCDVLTNNRDIHNERAFFRVAMKLALYKIYRHEKSEREQVSAYLNGDPPYTMEALRKGAALRRVIQSHCKRGHELIEGNLAYMGNRRTCLTCKRKREREQYEIRKAIRKSKKEVI